MFHVIQTCNSPSVAQIFSRDDLIQQRERRIHAQPVLHSLIVWSHDAWGIQSSQSYRFPMRIDSVVNCNICKNATGDPLRGASLIWCERYPWPYVLRWMSARSFSSATMSSCKFDQLQPCFSGHCTSTFLLVDGVFEWLIHRLHQQCWRRNNATTVS